MRTLERLAILMLAALAVLLLTWTMVGPPYDAKQERAERAAAAKGQAPMPGSEAALRKGIGDILAGRRAPEAQQSIRKMGPLRSLTYLGGGKRGLLPWTGDRFDIFGMDFQGGMLEGLVTRGPGGAPSFAGWRTFPPTPSQIVEGYAALPAGARAMQTLIQLGILLAVALIGRLALRVRL